jgi:hypothetical protein
MRWAQLLSKSRRRQMSSQTARLTVIDRRCGMEISTQQRIFEPCFATKGYRSVRGLASPRQSFANSKRNYLRGKLPLVTTLGLIFALRRLKIVRTRAKAGRGGFGSAYLRAAAVQSPGSENSVKHAIFFSLATA